MDEGMQPWVVYIKVVPGSGWQDGTGSRAVPGLQQREERVDACRAGRSKGWVWGDCVGYGNGVIWGTARPRARDVRPGGLQQGRMGSEREVLAFGVRGRRCGAVAWLWRGQFIVQACISVVGADRGLCGMWLHGHGCLANGRSGSGRMNTLLGCRVACVVGLLLSRYRVGWLAHARCMHVFPDPHSPL